MAANETGARAWRRVGLRARLTLATVLVLALALGLAALLVLRLSQKAMVTGVENVARPRTETTAALLKRMEQIGALAGQLPGFQTHLPGFSGQLLQVVDGQGRVVLAGSTDADRRLVNGDQLARVRRGEAVIVHDATLGQLVTVGTAATTSTGAPYTVLMNVPVDGVVESMRFIRLAVYAGVPTLVAFLGILVWIVLGSALRPVAALRRGAEDIVGHAPGRRLPVPDAQDEIHELAVTLNRMLDRLATASARQRAFTADAAHELRSPLASVRTQLEVALAHPNGQRWPDTARDVLTDVRRLTRLSEDLLALSRLEAEPAAGSDVVCRTDLAALTAAVAERFDAARVPVRAYVMQHTTAAAPAHDLDRVLTNLVGNAVRHATSEVSITVSAGPGQAALTVIDDGPGIPPDDRQRVFERFTRLDDARDRDAGGAGLGLAIVAETVKRYRGQVVLDDARPGLRATVVLPS